MHRVQVIRMMVGSLPGSVVNRIAMLVSGAQGRAMYESGDLNQGICAVGQVVGLIKDIPTVKELLDRIVAEAAAIMSNRLPQMIQC